MDLINQTALQTARLIREKSATSREVTQAYLDRIQLTDAAIGSFVNVDAESALAIADSVDQQILRGQTLSPLAGVPIALKDNLCTTSGVTSCASKILSNFRSPYDATVVTKLRDASLVVVGKTNMDEFAMGSSTENSSFFTTKNPWNFEMAPGGSSGGSAACVAAQQAPLSLGSDTGGSIRQPASLCGICGFKPTYGRVSRYGLVAFASSLDQIGPFANNCEDLAALLQIIAGHDARDSTSIPSSVPNFSSEIQEPIKDLRIGILPELINSDNIESSTRENLLAAIDVFKANGAKIIEVALPYAKYGIPTYYVIACSEASSNLSRYSGVHYGYRSTDRSNRDSADALVDMICNSRSEGFGAEVKRRIMLGTYALSAGYYDAYYLKALQLRRLIGNDFATAFNSVDIILGPTTPSVAFKLGAKSTDPISLYLEDLFTVGANLAGLPALSIPSGFTKDGLPTAIQMQGAAMQDSLVLQCGHWFQKWIGYQPTWPKL